MLSFYAVLILVCGIVQYVTMESLARIMELYANCMPRKVRRDLNVWCLIACFASWAVTDELYANTHAAEGAV